MRHTILLVTSQAYALTPIQAVLKTVLNYEPLICAPDRAIAVASNSVADLIIIDINHDTATRELIRYFKQQFPLIPLVALVPYGDLTTTEYALGQGADDFISQPIALERLRTSLRNALRMRHLLVRAGEQGGVVHLPDISPFRAPCGRLKLCAKWKKK